MTASSSYIKPVLIALFGFTMWTVGDAMIRFLKIQSDYPAVLVAAISMGWGAIMLICAAPKLGGIKSTFTLPKLKLRIFRGAVIAVSGFLSYITFSYLELATAYAIIFMAPFIGKILSVFMMGEKISKRAWAVTIIGFIGVLIALRPGATAMNIGIISAVAQAIVFAFGHILGRYIGEDNQTVFSLAIFQYIFITIGSTVPAYIAYQGLEHGIPISDLMLMFAMGTTSVIGGAAVSYGFTYAPSAYVAPIHYTQILFGTVWGILLFSEVPDIYVILGSAIIAGAGIALIRLTRAKEKQLKHG